MIFPRKPADWEDLEKKVCQLFIEAGCLATRNKTIRTVRGPVNVDVAVQDKTRRPHALILCECKNWSRKVSKTVIHAFRTVVQDSGANLGFIISECGFQPGSHLAAANANIKLVTWKQFQAEIYQRWFEAMENRLTFLSDAIVDLADAGSGNGSHPTLTSEAIKTGGEDAINEFAQLETRYVQFAFSSSRVDFRLFRKFPVPSNDPRAAIRKTIVFRSARMYFDIMLETAPQAYADYAAFLLKHTGGRCGSHQLLDDSIIAQISEGKTTMEDAHRLFGHRAWIQRTRDGEVWTFRGSITEFELGDMAAGRIGKCKTTGRILTINFGQNGLARHVTIEDFQHPYPPQP